MTLEELENKLKEVTAEFMQTKCSSHKYNRLFFEMQDLYRKIKVLKKFI